MSKIDTSVHDPFPPLSDQDLFPLKCKSIFPDIFHTLLRQQERILFHIDLIQSSLHCILKVFLILRIMYFKFQYDTILPAPLWLKHYVISSKVALPV